MLRSENDILYFKKGNREGKDFKTKRNSSQIRSYKKTGERRGEKLKR